MSQTPSILYVEDDLSAAEILILYFKNQGYDVTHFDNGIDASRAINNLHFDIAVLDIMLPKGDGRDLLKQTVVKKIPTLMVTAKIQESERLEGFSLGSDDYICKPYSPKEVIARVQALLNRSQRGHQQNILAFDGLTLDLYSKTATCDDNVVLTAVEFKILVLLATHPQKVFSRDALIEAIWNGKSEVTDRAVDTHLANIRKKLGDSKKEPKFIATRYGEGYQFIAKQKKS
jgi:two-component system alkaline phosphatase synthesis response regulator PhoP/two-component system response regulator BaeR